MKKAVIDQIFVWMILFTAFVTVFFMVLDTFKITKIIDKCDTISNVGARIIALKGIDDEDSVIDALNASRGSNIALIGSSSLECTESINGNYKVKFTTNLNFNSTYLIDGQYIVSTSSAFNELNNNDIECTLTLTIAE